MPKSNVFIVCDEGESTERAKGLLSGSGFTVASYTTSQWRDGLANPNFVVEIGGTPSLVSGGGSPSEPRHLGNVVAFPGMQVPGMDPKVPTMDELESKAIQNAIQQFRGNLTEAAKALGIGRATLYRKVKQYSIDPSQARRRRAA